MADISEKDRMERNRFIENAFASLRIEGLEPGEEAAAIIQKYAAGDLSLAEMGAAIDELNERDFGPVRLPRNERFKESA